MRSRHWPSLKALLNKAARDGSATCVTADLEQARADYAQLQYKHQSLLEVKAEMEKVLNGSQAECFRLSQEVGNLQTEVERLREHCETARVQMRGIVDGWTRSYTDKMRVTHRVCVFCGGLDGKCGRWCVKEELRAVLAETEESSDATDG